MKRDVSALISGLTIAAIWGYFADLQNGQSEWFIGRLVFTPLLCVGMMRIFGRKAVPEQKAAAEQ